MRIDKRMLKQCVLDSMSSIVANLGGGAGLIELRSPPRTFDPIRSLLILTPGHIPTLDIYLSQRIGDGSGARVECIDTRNKNPSSLLAAEFDAVIVVRSAPEPWLNWLQVNKEKLARIVFLMDDDLPAILQAEELPFRYALRTAWRYSRLHRNLAGVCDEVWVSTAELQRRYPQSAPRLCEPLYVPAPGRSASPSAMQTYFYHGSWAHRREIEWLVPVVREVQESRPQWCFEIFGSGKVRRMFHGIPRVRTVAPMNWSDYLAYAAKHSFEIGLAPCLDTPFNRARSHTKLFDITRLGAAGIYADIGPYTGKIIDGETGVLCGADRWDWVSAILRLMDDEAAREAFHRRALEWCLQDAIDNGNWP